MKFRESRTEFCRNFQNSPPIFLTPPGKDYVTNAIIDRVIQITSINNTWSIITARDSQSRYPSPPISIRQVSLIFRGGEFRSAENSQSCVIVPGWKFSYLSYHNAKLFIPYECTRGMFATTYGMNKRGIADRCVRVRAREEREKRYRTNLANFHINLLDRSDAHTHTRLRFSNERYHARGPVCPVPVSHLTLSMALQIPQTKYDRFNIASWINDTGCDY